MAESGAVEDVELEPRPVYGQVPLDEEEDPDMDALAAARTAVLTPPASTREKRRKKRDKHNAGKAQLTSNDASKKVELQSAKEVSQSGKYSEWQQKDDWWQHHSQSSRKWHSSNQLQQNSWKPNSQQKQTKRPQPPSHVASKFPRMNVPPPPKPFSRQAPAAAQRPAPSVPSSNPFNKSVSSQPSQPSIPANLPPGTVVCFLPK